MTSSTRPSEVCPRCGGGFRCGAREAQCDCFDLKLTDALRSELAVVAAAMTGACTGFLWWNAAPARIFMGDTGSLAIGAGLAGLGLIRRRRAQ